MEEKFDMLTKLAHSYGRFSGESAHYTEEGILYVEFSQEFKKVLHALNSRLRNQKCSGVRFFPSGRLEFMQLKSDGKVEDPDSFSMEPESDEDKEVEMEDSPAYYLAMVCVTEAITRLALEEVLNDDEEEL